MVLRVDFTFNICQDAVLFEYTSGIWPDMYLDILCLLLCGSQYDTQGFVKLELAKLCKKLG